MSVALIPSAMLHAIAAIDARTPLAPLTPQNHGVGFRSTAVTRRIPVGKAKPMRMPAGAIAGMQRAALPKSGDPSKCGNTYANHRGSGSRGQCGWWFD